MNRIETIELHWWCPRVISDDNIRKTSIITFTLTFLNSCWIICSGCSNHTPNSLLAGSNQFTLTHLDLGTGSIKRFQKLFLALDKLISSPRIPSLPDYFLLILLAFYLYCVLNNAEAQMSNFRT